MHNRIKLLVGVTLLEVMLVLAIASMIILMSVRYYQTATGSSLSVGALSMIQGITSVADGLAAPINSYSGITTDSVRALMPGQSLLLPWGAEITITGQSSSGYSVSLANTPREVCELLKARMAVNSKYTGIAANACASITAFTYAYDSTL